MSNSILREKSKDFAKKIILLCRELKRQNVEGVLTTQLLKCGTSIGANIHEAQYAQGSKDFISKLEIALKECNETEYWLELLFDTESVSKSKFQEFQKYCIEIRRMLVCSITTTKRKNQL